MTNHKFNHPNLNDAQKLLAQLFEEVNLKESELGEGISENLTRGSTAIKAWQETTVKFGDPDSRLIRLTEDSFNKELSDEIKQLMKRYDFYSLVISIEPKLEPNVVISQLKCNLDFRCKDDHQPNDPQILIHRILAPSTKWQTLVKAGINFNIGLDANLEAKAGIDTADLAKVDNLPYINADVETKNNLQGSLVLKGLNYESGKFEIFAQGENDSQADWQIKGQEVQDKPTIDFAIYLKVPQGQESIDLTGTVWIEPSIDWLNSNIDGKITKNLSGFLKDLFGSKKKAAESFAMGKTTTWGLKLPKP